MADVLILNGIVFTMDDENRVLKDGAVAIEGDRIVEVGDAEEVERKYSTDLILDT